MLYFERNFGLLYCDSNNYGSELMADLSTSCKCHFKWMVYI